MQTLAHEIRVRQIRVSEAFRDFDRLRCGFITTEQFKRCLSGAQLFTCLKAADADAIVARFTADNGKFNYAAFEAALEAEGDDTTKPQHSADAEQEAMIRAFTATFAQQLKVTGLELVRCFADFDKSRRGTMTASQFERCFPLKTDPRFIQAVKAKYAVGSGDVAYKAWCDDVAAMTAASTTMAGGDLAGSTGDWHNRQLSGTTTSPMRQTRAAPSVASTMAELRTQARTQQIRVQDYLRDYDKRSTGVVTAGRFQSALGRIKMPRFNLTAVTLDQLVEAYAAPQQQPLSPSKANPEILVDYASFIRDLEDGGAGSVAEPALQAPEDALRAEAVLGKVRTAIHTRRMNMKPTFQDFDRANKGIYVSLSCTRTRFERALAICNVRLTPGEIDLLERKYALSRAGEDDANAINYVAFCNDVDDQSLSRPDAPQYEAKPAALAQAEAARPSLQTVLDGVVLQLSARSIRLAEFLKEHDQLRRGTVPRDKVLTALTVAGIQIDDVSMLVLTEAFLCPGDATRVEYKKLLAAVDAEDFADAGATLKRIDEVRGRVADAVAPVEAETRSQVENVLARVREDVRSRQILLPPFFNDYDRHHRGLITAAQFERVLCRHRLPVNEADVNLLKSFFADPTQPTHVRCRDFVAAVDATEKSRIRGPASQAAPAAPVARASLGSSQGRRVSASTVVEKIATLSVTRAVRVKEFFRDTDPLRKGFCHAARFDSALDALNMHLSDAEIRSLASNYATSANNVTYSAFLADVEAGVAAIINSGGAASDLSGTTELSAARAKLVADKFLQRIVEQVRTAIRSRRMHTRTVMQDHDPLRRGRVTQPQFFSALSTLGIRFSALESAKLVQELIGTGEANEVTYKTFCSLVDDASSQ